MLNYFTVGSSIPKFHFEMLLFNLAQGLRKLLLLPLNEPKIYRIFYCTSDSTKYPPNLSNVVFVLNIKGRFSLSTRVSAFISLALVVVLVLHNNNFTISNFNRIKLYLTQVNILKLDQVNLDQLLILDGINYFEFWSLNIILY